MATESIFTNIVLSDPKEVQMLIDALEASKKDLKKETKISDKIYEQARTRYFKRNRFSQ